MKTGAPRALIVVAIVLAALGVAAAAAAVAIPQRTVTTLPERVSTSPSPTASTPAPRADDEERRDGEDELDEDSVAFLADPDWVTETAATAGIPQRALAAYAGAALELADTHPQCGIGWSTLAAIGYVESEHGTIGDSRIGEDGIATPEIIGVPLDGEGEDVARVRDTDNGAVDRDTIWDRAVGPMQFIPSTWRTWGRDGSGDDTVDIHNVDDAALSAGVYLCETGGDLSRKANWIKAVSAYNDSVEYNNKVADAADHYATVR